MAKRQIIQFGDRLNNLFIFPPFETEDEWGDNLSISDTELIYYDGSYVSNGYGQSRKNSKVLTKRFTIFNKELLDLEGDGYITKMVDMMYRGLSGGKKRLYARMEDGSIRYTIAERVAIPYADTYTNSNKSASYSVEFKVYDPYWYEVKDLDTVMFSNIDTSTLFMPCTTKDLLGMGYTDIFLPAKDKIPNNCIGQSVIVKDDAFIGLQSCVTTGCQLNPCFEHSFGSMYDPSSPQIVCVSGSAGAKPVQFGWHNYWINPSITNATTGATIQYFGVINEGEYVAIDQGSTITNDFNDMDVTTNIAGFNANSLMMSNPNCGVLEMQYANNEITTTGAQNSNSFYTVKLTNKYHN